MMSSLGKDMPIMQPMETRVHCTRCQGYDNELSKNLAELGYTINIMTPFNKVQICLLLVQTIKNKITGDEFTSFSATFVHYKGYVSLMGNVLGPDFSVTDGELNKTDFELQAWEYMKKYERNRPQMDDDEEY